MRTSVIGGRSVLGARGELDLATLPQLHNALVRYADEHRGETVVVDLDGVTTCDDAALGALLGCAGRLREAGGELVVVCTDGPLGDRLTRTGFDRAVPVERTIAAAMAR